VSNTIPYSRSRVKSFISFGHKKQHNLCSSSFFVFGKARSDPHFKGLLNVCSNFADYELLRRNILAAIDDKIPRNCEWINIASDKPCFQQSR